uniref:Sir2 family NAD-dependent protein deacetylase n=1 Tax=Eubacterium cellulosolvens TaxID=29322 RepID=UPI00068600AE|nr:Sir2 family NAD-dependent protein deacetylase [[Eubacterium] cellulosolvens]
MSISYLKEILTNGNNIVCLLGKATAAEQGCDLYREDFSYDVESRYGRSPSEIVSSTFYNNRPEVFYEFYREDILKRSGEPDDLNYSLRQMEIDGKLKGIVTRSFFDLSGRAGCQNVVSLYGNIEKNSCPHCNKEFSSDYILTHKPLPKCDECGTLIHPGIALSGEMLDSQVMTRAIEQITAADILLVLGTDLQSRLGSMAKYFNGDRICLVNSYSHYSDQAADCVCIGNISAIMHEAYPAEKNCREDRRFRPAQRRRKFLGSLSRSDSDDKGDKPRRSLIVRDKFSARRRLSIFDVD